MAAEPVLGRSSLRGVLSSTYTNPRPLLSRPAAAKAPPWSAFEGEGEGGEDSCYQRKGGTAKESHSDLGRRIMKDELQDEHTAPRAAINSNKVGGGRDGPKREGGRGGQCSNRPREQRKSGRGVGLIAHRQRRRRRRRQRQGRR